MFHKWSTVTPGIDVTSAGVLEMEIAGLKWSVSSGLV